MGDKETGDMGYMGGKGDKEDSGDRGWELRHGWQARSYRCPASKSINKLNLHTLIQTATYNKLHKRASSKIRHKAGSVKSLCIIYCDKIARRYVDQIPWYSASADIMLQMLSNKIWFSRHLSWGQISPVSVIFLDRWSKKFFFVPALPFTLGVDLFIPGLDSAPGATPCGAHSPAENGGLAQWSEHFHRREGGML